MHVFFLTKPQFLLLEARALQNGGKVGRKEGRKERRMQTNGGDAESLIFVLACPSFLLAVFVTAPPVSILMKEEGWDDRHQVCVSNFNNQLPKSKREFFDDAKQVMTVSTLL